MPFFFLSSTAVSFTCLRKSYKFSLQFVIEVSRVVIVIVGFLVQRPYWALRLLVFLLQVRHKTCNKTRNHKHAKRIITQFKHFRFSETQSSIDQFFRKRLILPWFFDMINSDHFTFCTC